MKKNKVLKENKRKIYSILVGSLVAISVFVLFGALTVLIPNSFFKRMTTIFWYDYVFIASTALLLGAYSGLWYYTRKTSSTCSYATAGGSVGSLFSFGCPICNKLLIFLLGITGVMTYFAPLQPLLGVTSLSLLGFVVYKQSKLLSKSEVQG